MVSSRNDPTEELEITLAEKNTSKCSSVILISGDREFRRVAGSAINVDEVLRTPLLNASSFQRKLLGYNIGNFVF